MIFCFDLDGVINRTPDDLPPPEKFRVFRPNWGVILAMHRLKEEGHKIIIYTARHPEDKDITLEFLRDFNVPYDEIIFGKPYADVYVDDRAMGVEDFLRRVGEWKR